MADGYQCPHDVSVSRIVDGVSSWVCSDCGHSRPRETGSTLRRKARLKQRGTSARARARQQEKSGPQAELCRRTMCCLDFARWWRARHGESVAIDWTKLPELGDGAQRSDAHHEPTVARGGKDCDTIPLSRRAHTLGFTARHNTTKTHFWARQWVGLGVGYKDVKAEMQRRTALVLSGEWKGVDG